MKEISEAEKQRSDDLKALIKTTEAELASGEWWWRRESEFSALFPDLFFGSDLEKCTEQDLVRFFEAQFSASAWMYEALRRFADDGVVRPWYPALPTEEKSRLASQYPIPEVEIFSTEPRPPGETWEPPSLAGRHYSLEQNTDAAILENIMAELKASLTEKRKKLGVKQPTTSGRPAGTWRGLEHFDLGKRVSGYFSLMLGVSGQISNAKKRAQPILNSLRI